MRRILVAACLVLGAVTGRAQQSDPRHPNFSGTWLLVPPSVDPQMAALSAPLGAQSVITQDRTAITLDQRGRSISVRLDVPETRYTTTNNAGTWVSRGPTAMDHRGAPRHDDHETGWIRGLV
jgi:hypothetical protein